jgi:hypothetical protein
MSDGKNREDGEKQEDRAKKLEFEPKEFEEQAEKLQEEVKDLEGKKPIEVVFNEKYPVKIDGKKQTGLSLKQAAIKDGVPIQLDFVLSIELGGGKTELIGDADPIEVKEGDRFLAIPNDDNS